MRLNKLLHPEIVLGTRGPKGLINVYKNITRELSEIDGKLFITDKLKSAFTRTGVRSQDVIHFSLCKMYKLKRPKAYYFPKDFLQDLLNIDKNIPYELLPKSFFGYFDFANGSVVTSMGTKISGCYVHVGKLVHLPQSDEEKKNYLTVSFVHEKCLLDIEELGNYGSLVVPFDDTGKLSVQEMISEGRHYGDEAKIMSSIHRLIVNCILYVCLPDFRFTKSVPDIDLSHSERKKVISKGNETTSDCTIPVTLVNWGYERPREYSVSDTWVTGHMRWQRCGEKLSQIKLIWIEGHERHYKSGDKDERNQFKAVTPRGIDVVIQSKAHNSECCSVA